MKANETTVLKILQGSKVFVIPSFQRRYSWRAKEWDLLWSDLIREYGIDHSHETQSLDGHFLGSVVLHPAGGPASTLMRHLVIDGQQRLTTLLILLAVIRDVRRELDPEWDPASYDAQYLSNPYDAGSPERLVPTRLDREAYVSTVRHSRLERLGETLLLHMIVVEINTTHGDSVHNIFNTLNSKGVPLSPSDLVRNELLLHVGEPESERAYEQYWLPMERALVQVSPKKLDDREFVTFLWSREVAVEVNTTRQELFSGFERRLRGALDGLPAAERQARALGLFEEIFEDHKLFLVLRAPLDASTADARIGRDLRGALDTLRRFRSEPSTPIALWILRAVARGAISEGDAVSTVDLLLGYLVRRALTGIPTNMLNRLLTPIARDLEMRPQGETAEDALRTIFEKRGYYWPSDREVLAGVSGQPLYVSAKHGVKLILQEAERLLPGHESADTDVSQVEHVIPQDLSPEWLIHFANRGVPPEAAVALRHTLGNLTLTDNNQSMGNALFADKRDEYFSSSALRLNRELATLDDFLPSQVRTRGRALANLLLRRFPGPVREAGNDSSQSLSDMGASVEERLEAALQAMPEGSWTTVDELVAYLGAEHDVICDAIDVLPSPLARLVRVDVNTTSGGGDAARGGEQTVEPNSTKAWAHQASADDLANYVREVENVGDDPSYEEGATSSDYVDPTVS